MRLSFRTRLSSAAAVLAAAGLASPAYADGQIDASTLDLVERRGLGPTQQLPRRLERACLDLRLSRGQSPFTALRQVRGQHRCTLEE